ncbi:Copia protein, partial [Mucuna pruriens]
MVTRKGPTKRSTSKGQSFTKSSCGEYCTYCKRPRHTKDTSYKLYGKEKVLEQMGGNKGSTQMWVNQTTFDKENEVEHPSTSQLDQNIQAFISKKQLITVANGNHVPIVGSGNVQFHSSLFLHNNLQRGGRLELLKSRQVQMFESNVSILDNSIEEQVQLPEPETYEIDYDETFAPVVKMNMNQLWIEDPPSDIIILDDLEIKYEGPIKLFCDNNSTISVQHDRTKHIEIDKHFIKEKLDNGLIVTAHIPTRLQVADVFTKGLPATRFQEFNDKLEMIDIHLPT